VLDHAAQLRRGGGGRCETADGLQRIADLNAFFQ
jgi:hypothetical protein